MNNVNLVGRLTANPELKYTTSQKAVCDFTLAVNAGKDKADFIRCQVWDVSAENLCKYQTKGSLISLQGAIKNEMWEDNGQKKYKTKVLAFNIQYLGSKQDSQQAPQQGALNVNDQKSVGDYWNTPANHINTSEWFNKTSNSGYINDEDMPF